ncbi:hypothetical protein [Salmonirosea aquatica]|uniref:Uncharacterized protein n=1 Tax=Salmonirosea aquatica TaxID=2654236 RepID=A0A7C9FPK0_9BACT|nr:hypothetical protein [Cytophagaceae bacterium SJW1-29]
MKNLSSLSKLVGILLLVGTLGVFQSSFTWKETTDDLSVNRVLFNGAPLYTSTMLLDARGVLALVEGTLANDNAKKIPFQVYVKRGDVVIAQASSVNSRLVNEIEVGRLLMGAQKGDELIIEPIEPNKGQARRVIKLAGYTLYQWFPIIRGFPITQGSGNGC